MTVATLEPWVTKAELAGHLATGVRWIEYRMAEGMPHAMIGGKAKFRASVVEKWLLEHGHLEERGAA